MADNTARPIGPALTAERRPRLRLVAGVAVGEALPAPIVPERPVPLLSLSREFLGIGPAGWGGATLMLAVVALTAALADRHPVLTEPEPIIVRVIQEAPPPPLAMPAEVLPPPPPANTGTPPESTAEAPLPFPPPEAVAETQQQLPPPPEAVAEAPQPRPPPDAVLPQPPPPKPQASSPPRRVVQAVPAPAAVAAAPTAAATAPTQEAALPVLPPRGVAGNAKPDYPLAARQRRLEGRVVLRVEVSAAGEPTSVTIARSSGHEVLDQAALGVVRRWRFNPATRGGGPVAGSADVPIQFRMED